MKPSQNPSTALPPRVEFARLEERVAASGLRYFAGYAGGVRLVLLPDRDFAVDPEKPAVVGRWVLSFERAEPRKPKATSRSGGGKS